MGPQFPVAISQSLQWWLGSAVRRYGCGARQKPQAPAFAPASTDRREFWKSVRAQFVMPDDLGRAQTLRTSAPPLRPVLEALRRESDSVDRDPSAQNRSRGPAKKEKFAPRLRPYAGHAGRARHHPQQSEANNMVSSGGST